MDRFISKEAWGANPSKEATEDSHPIGSTLGITFHWVGPHVGRFDHSECAGKVRGIERHHEYGNGWGDIAYNLLVCPHGYAFEGRGVGVRSAANGSTQTNDDWYAVCYLGGELDGFTENGKAGFTYAVQLLRRAGAGPKVNGHRDHKATSCPGPSIYAWLQTADFSEEPTITARDREQYANKRARVRDLIKRLKASPVPRAAALREQLRKALKNTRSK